MEGGQICLHTYWMLVRNNGVLELVGLRYAGFLCELKQEIRQLKKVLSPVHLYVLRWAIADSTQIGISTFRGDKVKLNNSLCIMWQQFSTTHEKR